MDKLEVINRALQKVGLPRSVNLDDCDWNAKEVYENTVQETLRKYAWSFAQRFASLTPAGIPPHGYSHAYALPQGCLRVIDIHLHNELRAPIARYVISGKQLFCNIFPCNIRYITDLQDPADWTPDFCDVVACRIATEIAALSGQKSELVPQLKQLYELALAEAEKTDANESTERVPLDMSIWAARATNKV